MPDEFTVLYYFL